MIKQQSQEWLETKKRYVGASEIFALASYYCKEEMAQAGIELAGESSFQTPLEVFLEKKFNIEREPIDPVRSQFGLGMEDYILSRIPTDNYTFEKCDDFVIKEDWIACSPDAYCFPKGEFKDFDKKNKITEEWGKGVCELKTVDFGFNFESKLGAKWQYIFQLQYQMLCCGVQWGMLACLAPSYNMTDFEKGKYLVQSKTNPEELEDKFNLYTYVFAENKAIQKICLLAVERFKQAMEQVQLPAISVDNKAKLLREKKMLSALQPNRFGEIEADEELNNLLDEIGVINAEKIKLETDLEANKAHLILLMKDNVGVNGMNYKAKFDKRGYLTVRKI